jgi:CRISPR-associated protein Csm4
MEAEKDLKKKQWMELPNWGGISLSGARYLTEREVFKKPENDRRTAGPAEDQEKGITLSALRAHNTINRLTGTTGKAPFTPFTSEVIVYPPGVELAVFLLLDPEATSVERVAEGLNKMGTFGYGRDASTGLGRFAVGEPRPLPDPGLADAGALYTLAPSVPDPSGFKNIWFAPFVRLGKHGDKYALSGNPFKNPVVMADEGAVLETTREGNWDEKPYVGRSIHNVSLNETKTVVQGYSPVIPLAMEH